jgi:hypothetical protein
MSAGLSFNKREDRRRREKTGAVDKNKSDKI